MSEPPTFGRRRPAIAPPTAKAAPAQAPAHALETLSPEAEALRAQLAADRGGAEPSFADWRRSQRSRQAFAWFMTFVLLSPGALCFLFQAPVATSTAVEVLGMGANFWLRRERRRRLKEIAGWDGPSAAG